MFDNIFESLWWNAMELFLVLKMDWVTDDLIKIFQNMKVISLHKQLYTFILA